MNASLRSRVEAGTGWLRARLEAEVGCTEVGAVFVVPVTAPPWGGTESVGYAVQVPGMGRDLHLRSHGMQFNIVPRPWLGEGLDACYSIGPGLVDGVERLVVLAQTFRRGGSGALDLVAGDDRWEGQVLRADLRCYGRACSLLSGVVG